jgi:archaellum component FlaF (FlaF/FlaG flagellin family)
MKGVSAIIAIILILMIVVALSALAYTWFSGIFSSLTTTTSNATSQATTAMAMQFRIETAKWYTPKWVNATLRNIGTVNFDIGKLAVYVDGVLSIYAPNATGTYLTPGQTITINITNATAACPNEVLSISLESGLQDSRTISC